MLEKDARDQIPQQVDRWFREQSLEPYAHFYLFIKPAPDAELVIAQEAPDGFELADSQRISPAWTRDEALDRINKWARRLPVLG